MGFQLSTGTTLWEQYRDQFPVTSRFIYLNHAAVAPLCKAARDAMNGLAEDAWNNGSYHYDQWLAAYEGLRQSTGRLIGASRDEIAIVKNTSEGISTVALGIAWKPGDRIVCFTEEFPSNLLPWLRLERRGVIVERLSINSPLEEIEAAARGARLLAVSFVQFLSGYRADLRAIGDICRRNGCFFFVDAIQGLGAFPLNVEECGVDALSADGHKWLLGPEGCGILYVRRSRLDQIEPVEFGWTNVAEYERYVVNDTSRLRPDAGRYECGTLNTIGCFGLRAAIEFVLEVGVPRIAAAVQSLGDRLAAGAQAKGYEILGIRTPACGAGIVSIRKPGTDSRMIVRRLKEGGALAAPRNGWVRMSPHFYISPDEIDNVVDLLH